MNLAQYFQAAATTRETLLTRYSDLVLVTGVVAIIALMVLPLPIFVIDVLVAVNLVMGVMLLLMSIYIAAPLEFSVFPSVLLLSTLFRLALSIATTRLILLHGDAGHIIDTFGKVVAGGNLVVGLVVFLIITVVQFIVIAKGAERVAEVAARFTLDAMPGKQMSIDSDLRSGLIDKDEARRKRHQLEQESKLHGNLDGAMKFVKGDTIAGIVIIVINLLGGLAVGSLQLGMPIGDAMVKYSVLTIGDGMVSQIPALLAAMAAGIIVTRTSDSDDKHLGDAIRKQFMAKPRVLIVAGGISCLLSLMPGFPAAVFIVVGLGMTLGGALRTPAMREHIDKALAPAFSTLRKPKQAPAGVTATALPPARPAVALLLEVPTHAMGEDGGELLTREMASVLDHFQLRLGLPLPQINIHAQAPGLAGPGATSEPTAAGWRLLAFEVPIAQGVVPAQNVAAELRDAAIHALRRHTTLFIGMQETSNLLTRASLDYPEIVKEVLRALPMQRIADILRRLVEEEVSIRNVRDMLESLAEAGQREKDLAALTEFARIALKRHISYQYAPDNVLRAVLLQPDLEEMLRQALRVSGGVQQLAIDPHAAREVIDLLVHNVRTHLATAIVTTVDLRRHVRKLIELECFDIPVLSYHELMPSLRLDVAAKVGSPGTPLLEAA